MYPVNRLKGPIAEYVEQRLRDHLPTRLNRKADSALRSGLRIPARPLWRLCPRTCACNGSVISAPRKRRWPRTRLRCAWGVRLPDDFPFFTINAKDLTVKEKGGSEKGPRGGG